MIDLIHVEGGEYIQGYSHGNSYKNNTIFRRVSISSFEMSSHLITQSVWEDVMNYNPSNTSGSKHPVEMVCWYDAVEFCNQLSLKQNLDPCYIRIVDVIQCDFTKNGFRLPTEAEWEYAAKGGINKLKFVYAGSDNISEVAWYKNNSGGTTHEIGRKLPNSLGIYDLSGNLWEWCWDWYSVYSVHEHDNPVGPVDGETKVYRGGSFLDFDYGCTVTIRGNRKPVLKQTDIGFRVVRSLL